jgi:outer membrane protein
MRKPRSASVILILGLAAIFWAGNPCAAADRRHISLAEALRIAMRQNRSLQAAGLEQQAAGSEVTVARAQMLPRLDAIENYSNSNYPPLVFTDILAQQDFSQSDFSLHHLNFPSPYSNFQSQVVLSQSLFAGGRLLAALRAADDQADIRTFQDARTREQVEYAVIEAYYRAVLAEETTGVVQRALDAAQAHRGLAKDRFNQGMTLKSDLLRTEVLLGTLEQRDIEAREQLRIAWAALAHTLGAEDEAVAPLEPGDALSGSPPPELARLDELEAEAPGNRPEFRIAHAQVDAARQQVTIARAEYLPSVNLAATYENDSQYLTRAGNSYLVFLNVKQNIFNGFASKAGLDAARARLSRAEVLERDLREAIALEVETAYRNLTAARKNINVARQDNDYAADALKILEDRYRSGLAANVDVLEAQAAREQADMQLAQARVAVVIDEAALRLATGESPGGDLVK